MKPEVLALFDEKMKKEAAERFSLEPTSLKMLNGFENVVMEASRNGTPYILRISHGSHRTADQIHAELHSHSSWSDGKLSILEMAQAGRQRGLKVLAITWQTESLGFSRLALIREDVMNVIDVFIEAYLSENPRKKMAE